MCHDQVNKSLCSNVSSIAYVKGKKKNGQDKYFFYIKAKWISFEFSTKKNSEKNDVALVLMTFCVYFHKCIISQDIILAENASHVYIVGSYLNILNF